MRGRKKEQQSHFDFFKGHVHIYMQFVYNQYSEHNFIIYLPAYSDLSFILLFFAKMAASGFLLIYAFLLLSHFPPDVSQGRESAPGHPLHICPPWGENRGLDKPLILSRDIQAQASHHSLAATLTCEWVPGAFARRRTVFET